MTKESEERFRAFTRWCEKVLSYYHLYRILFFLNIGPMIGVPIQILILRQHVPTPTFINCVTGWFYTLVCWKHMRWDLFIDEFKELWRRIHGKKEN